jgi:hypothetical protein
LGGHPAPPGTPGHTRLGYPSRYAQRKGPPGAQLGAGPGVVAPKREPTPRESPGRSRIHVPCIERALDRGAPMFGQSSRFQPVAQLDDRRRVPLAAGRARYLASVQLGRCLMRRQASKLGHDRPHTLGQGGSFLGAAL